MVWGFALAMMLGLVGCGSGKRNASAPGSSSRSTGRAVVTLRWPDPTDTTRLVPVNSKSVRIRLKEGATTVAERLLPRPDAPPWVTTASFENVPIITLSASATAYPNADGTGVAQATVTTPITMQAEGDTNLRLTMASTIDHIEVTPGGPLALGVQESATLQAVPRDANNNIVLANAIQFTATPEDIVELNPDGSLSGLDVGTTTITAREPESGKFAQVNVTVSRSASYRVTWLPKLEGSQRTIVTGINNKGEITGFSQYRDNNIYGSRIEGWIWRPNATFTRGTYTMLPLTLELPDGGTELVTRIEPQDINDAGHVVGVARGRLVIQQPTEYAFYWDGAHLRKIPDIQDALGHAYSVNSKGNTVGSVGRFNDGGIQRGAFWSPATETPKVAYAGVGIVGTDFMGIGEDDTIVGTTYINRPRYYPQFRALAIQYRNDVVTPLPPTNGYESSEALAVNLRGDIVGWAWNYRTEGFVAPRAILWRNAIPTDLGTLATYDGTLAYDVNETGVIVGDAVKTSFHLGNIETVERRPLRWRNGLLEDLNTQIPSFLLTDVPDQRLLFSTAKINNRGQICGLGTKGIYLLTPQVDDGEE